MHKKILHILAGTGIKVWNNFASLNLHSKTFLSLQDSEHAYSGSTTNTMLPYSAPGLGNSPKAAQEPSNITEPPPSSRR